MPQRVKLKDLAIMSRQFATMIGAGLSLLRVLASSPSRPRTSGSPRRCGRCATTSRPARSLSDALGQAPEGLPAADDQHGPGRRGRRLPRPCARADRGQPRGRGQAPRQDQVRDDLPGRRRRRRGPARHRHAAVHRPDLPRPVRRPRRHAAAADPDRGLDERHGEVPRADLRGARHRGRRAVGEVPSRGAGPRRRRPAQAQGAGVRQAVPQGRPGPLDPQPVGDARRRRADAAGASTSSRDTTGSIVVSRALGPVREAVRTRRGLRRSAGQAKTSSRRWSCR